MFTAKKTPRPQLTLEALEDRFVPSNIVWVNRGDDNFGRLVMLGTTPSFVRAREVVDTAISYWEQVIQDFHWDDPEITQFDLTVEVDQLEPGTRASTSGDHDDSDDTPFAATITLDIDADGSGWFIDGTPRDNSEFLGNVTERDVAFGTFNGNDMLRTVMHEIGHAMGFSESADGFEADDLKMGDYLTDTGEEDPLGDGENLEVFDGGLLRVSFTDAGGLHVFENNITYEDHVYFGANDLMNSGRNSPDSSRKLISDLDAKVLAAAYGYDVKLPSTILGLSYLANLAPGNVLSILNDPESSIDNYGFVRNGAQRQIHVNGTTIDVPSMIIPSVSVNSTDRFGHLTVDFSGGDLVNIGGALVFNAGGEHDVLTLESGPAGNTFVLNGSWLTVTGNGVSDTIRLVGVEDLAFVTGAGDNSITIKSTPAGLKQITVTGGSGRDNVVVQKVTDGVDVMLDGGMGNDNIRIHAIPPHSPFMVRGGGDTDVIVVGNAAYSLRDVEGQLYVFGGEGSGDALILKDIGTPSRAFLVRNTGLVRTGMGTVTWAFSASSSSGFESILLQAGTGNDTFTVESMPNDASTLISAGAGLDTLVGSDTGFGLIPNFWTITKANKGTFNGLTFAAMENLRGGAGNDLFSFEPAGSISGKINGGGGTNALNYSTWSKDVYVNLAATQATNVVGGIVSISQATGGSGSDILVGNLGRNVLSGNGGRDVIIGGLGADSLRGGEDEDLLIAGRTAYDLNADALNAVGSPGTELEFAL